MILTVDNCLLAGDFKKQQMRMILPESASPVSVGVSVGVDIGGRSISTVAGRSHTVGAAAASVPPPLPPRCRVRFLSDSNSHSHSHSHSHIHSLREKEIHRLQAVKEDPKPHRYPHMRMPSSSHIFASSKTQTRVRASRLV